MSSLPPFFDDEILGRMEYNPKLSWYEGGLYNERLGIEADISLPAKTHNELVVHKEQLRKAVHAVGSLVALGKESAQTNYFDNGYLDDPATNQSSFRERLELTTLWIEDSGRLVLSFSTDGMFPGLAIRVDFDSDLSKATSTLW
ncbi:hypothetical protein SH449x_002188 [Pirellulaceae bacterium SH449]